MALTALARDRSATAAAVKAPLIAVRDVALGYGGLAVLEHVSLEVEAGEFLGIVGPNGSGKTTLIKAILGLLPPRSGTISLADGPGGAAPLRLCSPARYGGRDLPGLGAPDRRHGTLRTRGTLPAALAGGLGGRR